MAKLLVVDDEVGICNLLKSFFSERGYEVFIANDGRQALELIKTEHPHLVFLDVRMPGISGVEVLKQTKEFDESIKAIMITAVEEDEVIAQAKEYGASDYVTKPFSLEYLEGTVLTKINAQLYEELRKSNDQLRQSYEKLKQSLQQMVLTLAETVETKDPYTGSHQEEVLAIGMALGEHLVKHKGLDIDMETLRMSLHLHDIGKQGIPDSILNKPGPLTNEEWVIMKKHPEMGAKILGHIDELKRVAYVTLHHQEKFDGTGYPAGLKGEEIPVEARIIAVADAFHAMTSDRSYRKALDTRVALDELKKCSGMQFDSLVVEAFLELFKEGKLPKSGDNTRSSIDEISR